MDERVLLTTAFYDAAAGDYAAVNAQTPPDLATFRDSFATRVGPGGRVADLGCGPGRDCRALAQRDLRVVGVDLAHQMLRQSSPADTLLIRGDLRRPPLRRLSLDGIWAAASLLHVPSADLAPTLAAWRQLLRRGGTLGFTTSLGDDEGWEVSSTGGRQWFVNRRREPLLAALSAARFMVISASERRSHRRWLQVLAATA